jgi:hypothetical protein
MKIETFMLKIFLAAAILLSFVPQGYAMEKLKTAEPVTNKTQVIKKNNQVTHLSINMITPGTTVPFCGRGGSRS